MPMQVPAWSPSSVAWSWEAGGLCHLQLLLEKWKDAGRAQSSAGLWLRALGKRYRARATHHRVVSLKPCSSPCCLVLSRGWDGILGSLENLSLLKHPCMSCGVGGSVWTAIETSCATSCWLVLPFKTKYPQFWGFCFADSGFHRLKALMHNLDLGDTFFFPPPLNNLCFNWNGLFPFLSNQVVGTLHCTIREEVSQSLKPILPCGWCGYRILLSHLSLAEKAAVHCHKVCSKIES